jgi:hypothetical protein
MMQNLVGVISWAGIFGGGKGQQEHGVPLSIRLVFVYVVYLLYLMAIID